MNSKKIKKAWWLIILFALLISNCNTMSSETPTITIPPTLTMTPYFLPTPTSILVEPTKTYTAVPAATTLPILTLSAEEKEKVISQLLTQDYHCLLPCWAGIEPGITTWPDAKAILEKFAQIYSSKPGIYTAEFQYKEEKIVLGFYTYNNLVEFIAVPRFGYPLYRLFQDYGKPDEVYFYVIDALPVDANNPYTIYLFYKEKGIVAEYNGVSVKGATISVCFRDSQGGKSLAAFLSLWSKGSDKTFHDVVAQYMSKFSDYLSLKYYKLEELSHYTVNDFFEIYKLEENENNCLQIENPNPTPS